MGPYSGIIVGLEFESHTYFVGFGIAHSRHAAVGVIERAEEILHVVSDFVCDHIGIGEISRRTYGLFHIFEKIQVDIHCLVGRTVKWPHLG